jgi:Na+-driven multidrug efflux pump
VAVGGQRTSLVALTTVTRLLVLTILLFGVVASGIVAGAIAAAWAMVLGIAAETTFILWSTRREWTPELGRVESSGMRQAYGDVLRVAAPLAIAALGWTATRPLVHAILGRLDDPERAQAGFGVLLPWLLLAGAPVWALLETTLVLARTSDDEARLRRFAMLLATGVAMVIALMVSPPVRDAWITVALGRDPGLLMAIESALPWLVLAPLLVAARAVAQGLLMRERQTTALLYLSPIRFVLVGCVGFLVTVWFPRTDGPAFALLLIMGGDALDALTYSLAARRACVRSAQARQACSGSEPIPFAEPEPQRRIA